MIVGADATAQGRALVVWVGCARAEVHVCHKDAIPRCAALRCPVEHVCPLLRSIHYGDGGVKMNRMVHIEVRPETFDAGGDESECRAG